MSEQKFDDVFRRRLEDAESRVPGDLWDAVAAQKFDEAFRTQLGAFSSAVPAGAWSSIQQQKFDQSFATRLRQAVSPVSDHIWPQISRRLHQRDRTPILLLLLLGLLMAGTALKWSSDRKTTDGVFPNARAVQGNQLPDNQNQLGFVPVEAPTAETDKDTQELQPGSSMAENSISLAQSSPPKHSIVSDLRTHKEEKASKIRGSANRASTPAEEEALIASNSSHEHMLSSPHEKSVDASDSEDSHPTEGPSSAHAQRNVSSLSYVPGITFEHLNFDRNPQINCPNLSVGRRSSLFLELRLTPGYPLRSLKDTSGNEESTPYIERRKNTEQPTSTFGLQALVGLEFEDLEVKTGVALSQIHEVFDFIDQTSSRTIVDTIRDMSGNVIDISIVREYGTRLKRSNNRYTFIDIPLIFGYRIRPKEDHSIWLRAGAHVNLAFMKSGSILSESEDVLDLKEVDFFKTRAGIRGTVSLGYELDITDKNSIGLQLIYSHPFSNLTIDGYPIQQQYKRAQVGFSWKHKLW
ncbi:MAG: PorT family protein [Saprospiraceae bacterium]|nr:PorT family protein [Saprospiraceae bacterium]